jgi:hypothetical protein
MHKAIAVTSMIFLWAAMLPVATVTTVSMTGCTPGQVENEINTIIQQAAGIIAVADPGAPWLADFTKAANLLKVDEAAWIKGGAVQDVINVLTDLEQVTALIPTTVPYASLVGILFAGAAQVLALLLPTPSAASPAVTASAPNPWRGLATVKSAKDSRSQWNLIVSQRPGLAAAKI